MDTPFRGRFCVTHLWEQSSWGWCTCPKHTTHTHTQSQSKNRHKLKSSPWRPELQTTANAQPLDFFFFHSTRWRNALFTASSFSLHSFSSCALILSRSLHLMEENEGPEGRACLPDTNIHVAEQRLALFFTALPLFVSPPAQRRQSPLTVSSGPFFFLSWQ